MAKAGDLLIRTAPSRDEIPHFVLLDAVSERVLAGPVLFDVVLRTARERMAPGARIWQQFTDERGRPTGPMMPLGYQMP